MITADQEVLPLLIPSPPAAERAFSALSVTEGGQWALIPPAAPGPICGAHQATSPGLKWTRALEWFFFRKISKTQENRG